MTQEQLAKLMCIPKSTISAYENDKVDIKGSALVELSGHLDITPDCCCSKYVKTIYS